MKRVFANFNLKKSASVLAAAALLTLGSAKLQAAPIIEKIISPSDKEVNVTFVGATDNSLVFHLNFENKTGEKFYLIVKNDAGDIVYQGAYSDVHFEKNIRIQKEDSEIHPTFVIRTSTEQIERKFSVNRQVSENFVVTNL
ncbi:MAG: hypothetical protein M3N30_08640 [Bacteroidota bacterium]|nr:hypothetical protein [Bacteroidota bacterium]